MLLAESSPARVPKPELVSVPQESQEFLFLFWKDGDNMAAEGSWGQKTLLSPEHGSGKA